MDLNVISMSPGCLLLVLFQEHNPISSWWVMLFSCVWVDSDCHRGCGRFITLMHRCVNILDAYGSPLTAASQQWIIILFEMFAVPSPPGLAYNHLSLYQPLHQRQAIDKMPSSNQMNFLGGIKFSFRTQSNRNVVEHHHTALPPLYQSRSYRWRCPDWNESALLIWQGKINQKFIFETMKSVF